MQAARLPVDFVKALLNHNDKGVTGIYARWHMFEEKCEAVMAIETAVLPLLGSNCLGRFLVRQIEQRTARDDLQIP